MSQSVSQSVNVQVVDGVTESSLLLVGSVDNRSVSKSVSQSVNIQVVIVEHTLPFASSEDYFFLFSFFLKK